MPRTVKEWVGKTADSRPSDHCVLRLMRAQQGRCAVCTRKLGPANPFTIDHIKALVFDVDPPHHGNRESNLQLICTDPCSKEKSGEETSRKAKADAFAVKHYGIDKQRKEKSRYHRPMPGSRASPWKKKLHGQVVRRDVLPIEK